MIEYAILAFGLYKQPTDVSLRDDVLKVLTGPRVGAVYSPPVQHHPLELRLVAQNGEGKEYTLEQVKDILSKPYLNPTHTNEDAVYDELLSRGTVVKYALNKFPTEELRKLSSIFYDYRLEIRKFQFYFGFKRPIETAKQSIDSIRQNIYSAKQCLDIIHQTITDAITEVLTGKKYQAKNCPEEPDMGDYNKNMLEFERIKWIFTTLMIDYTEDIYDEITQLMKAKGFK